ncbi:MAG: glycosyltransferase [Romboutsia sp.]
MKKILFMCINMNIGGTEKALLTMLNEMDRSKYEITLLMLEEYGGFLNQIPDGIKVMYLKEYKTLKKFINDPPQLVAKELIKNRKIIKGLSVLFVYIISKLMKDISIYYKYILSNVDTLNEEYDIAIAYAGPMDFISYFVINKIKSKKRVQWIHFDISKIGFNVNFAKKIHDKFDKVFVVSNEGKDKLINFLPSLKDKTEVFFNIISCKMIEKMSYEGEGFSDDFDGTRILTVGRLSKEKGQDLIIPVLKKLKENGYKVRWYCIGDGPAKKEYEKLVDKLNIKDDFIFLGSKLNPYTYMKECNIYVQPSKHEGYCITLGEARCFNNPIVTTNFTGANEQIVNENTGLVCEINEEEIYKAIKKLLDDKKLYKNIKDNLNNEIVDSTKEIRKLESILV